MVDTTCWKVGELKTRALQRALDWQLAEGGALAYSEDNGATWREVGLGEALAIQAKTTRRHPPPEVELQALSAGRAD